MEILKRRSLLAGLLLFCVVALKAKDTYSIKVKITGLKDTVCYLANHYGDKQYIQDTARVDSKGNFVFIGNRKLPGGIYMVVLPNKKYFEVMIVDKEQNFSIETDTADLVKNLKVKGSNENKIFYEYLHFIGQKQKEVEPVRANLEKYKDKKDSSDKYQNKLNAINNEVKSNRENFLKQNQGTFVVKVFKASDEPVVPEPPKLANGRPDSTFAFRYYKSHLFDNIDFSDDKMLRTPVFMTKVKQYLDNLTVQTADSLKISCDYLAEKARANKEVFKYIVYYTTYTYETSKIMGMDAVFVHLVEKYYMTNQAYWMDSTQLRKITDRAMTLKPLLIGKRTWNLSLEDTNGVFHPLYDVKAKYTVLFFWDPDCGHCQKAIPKLVEVYDKYKSMGVEVYAGCTETEVGKWKKMIRDKNLKWINVADPDLHNNFRHDYDITSTPQIYVLDENKIIKAKKLDADQLADIFEKLLVDKKNILN